MNLGLAKRLDRVVGGLLAGTLGLMDRVRESLRAPAPVAEVRHILIVKFWGLGNWALLRPIVRDLRARHPGARFTVATLAGNEPLVADLADGLILVHPRSVWRTLRDLARAVRTLRKDPPDMALDFEQFARSGALLARLGGARQRIGFRAAAGGRDDLYTVTVPWREDAHASRSFRDLAEAGGLAPGPYVPGGLEPTPAGRAEALAITAGLPYVVLHPGSGDNFTGRRWSTAGFGAVGRTARAAGRRVFVTGGVRESELVAATLAAVAAGEPAGHVQDGDEGQGVTGLAGALSLEGLVALLAQADALASNDTGPVHLASQLDTPVLAFYGPNTPVLYGPLSAGSRAFYRDLPCSPCITVANYRSSRCRIHSCMASIPTGEVTAALERLLTAPSTADTSSGAAS